jgi:hypothetical protein
MPLNKPTTLQDICTSLETSRKLAEAGFPQEGGIAYWRQYYKCEEDIAIGKFSWQLDYAEEFLIDKEAIELEIARHRNFRAWTFNELWEILPRIITIGNEIYYRRLLVLAMIGYLRTAQSKRYKLIQGENIQEAAAELALWCRKEGYL